MIQILLLLFLLLIVIYIVSYFQINMETFNNSNENLITTINFIDNMNYDEETNNFIFNNKILGTSYDPFRLGMWELETENGKTYINFVNNGKLGYFYNYERDYIDTYTLNKSEGMELRFIFERNTYILKQKSINEYENADATVSLKKMTEFTIKTNSSGNKSTTCGENSGEVSEFFLNDLKYEPVCKSEPGNLEDYGLHILVLNDNGSISDYQHFNTHRFMNQYINAINYIKSIETDKIVALNVYGDASKYGQPTIELYKEFLESRNNNDEYYGVIRHFTNSQYYNINSFLNNFGLFGSSILYEDLPNNLSSVVISQGLKVKAYEKINGKDPKIHDFNYNNTINGIMNFEGNKNNKVNSLLLQIDESILNKYFNIYVAFKLIGGPILQLLYENQSLSMIGRKDELLGTAVIATETPEIINCQNKQRGYSKKTVSASRKFVLEAFQEPTEKMKINVISLGNSSYKGYPMHKGYSELYLNNKQIANFTSRGINAIVLNPDGTIFNESSFDTSEDNANFNRFVYYIKSVPNGKIVCISFYDEAAYYLNPHVKLYYEPNNVEEYYKLFYDENTQGKFNDFRYQLKSIWCQNTPNRRGFQYNFFKEENVDMMPNPFRNRKSKIRVEGIQERYCNMELNKLNDNFTVLENIQWTREKIHTVQVETSNQFNPDPNRMSSNIENAKLIHPANKWEFKSINMTPKIKIELYEGKNFSGELIGTIRYNNTNRGNYNIPSRLFNRIGSIKLVPDTNDNIVTFSDALRSCGLEENIIPNYHSSFAFIGIKGGNISAVKYKKSNRYGNLRLDKSDEAYSNYEDYTNVELEI